MENYRIFGARARSARDDAEDASLRCSGVLSRAKDASLSKVGASVQERDAIAVAKDASLASMRAKDASLAYKRAKDASLVPSLVPSLATTLPKMEPKMHLWQHISPSLATYFKRGKPISNIGCSVQLAGCETPDQWGVWSNWRGVELLDP